MSFKNEFQTLSMLLIYGLAALFSGCSQPQEKNVYLFSYFKENGEDGLHLAYSYDGLKWTALKNDQPFLAPAVGAARLMRDPCIVYGPDNMFHLVWTASWWDKGIGLAHSKDLIVWSGQEFIPVMAHEPTALNCWAPEIFYDDATRQYVIYWSTTIQGRFPETEGGGDIKSDTGERLNHRMYYVTTKDFKEYSETGLFYNDGFNVIDGTIVKDNPEYVLFLKDETRYPEPKKNIRMATSNHILGPYSSASEPITGNYWAEGPTVIKIGNKWHLYFDKYTAHQFGVLISGDLKNWLDLSDQLQLPEGIRHGTIFRVEPKILDRLLTVK